jgi:hypothetical protein
VGVGVGDDGPSVGAGEPQERTLGRTATANGADHSSPRPRVCVAQSRPGVSASIQAAAVDSPCRATATGRGERSSPCDLAARGSVPFRLPPSLLSQLLTLGAYSTSFTPGLFFTR